MTPEPSAKAPKPVTVFSPKKSGLGTFGGVFTPSILTILGVIMYLRFGWVVGNVGLVGTLIIVTLSTSITLLTALSISEIATDQHVRAGGAYYMISRSLGIESGGAVGIPLYLAQALSVALYTVGFAESVVKAFPALDQRLVGLVTTVLIAVLALVSSRIAIKAQYFIMAAIVLSLISFAFGHPIEPTHVEMWRTPASSAGFWVVFAVFFPAVTGIMSGVNMSGDLKNPARSIPIGTLAAVATGYLIYMTVPVFLAARADSATLIADSLIMRRMALWGDAILIGVWGATLSSALGSILGAPRVLQALARDNVLPRPLRWLGRGDGEDDEPRLGTLVTLLVALLAVAAGNLDVIAPVLTMFFLTTYGVLNITAGVERFLGSPSFRPKFRVHWTLSILGAVGCVAVMFLINALATVVAAAIIVLIFIWLERREMTTAWGDVRRGIWLAVIRTGLLRLGDDHPKNWRPHPLVLAGAPNRRWHLIDFASSLTHNKGLMTVASVLPDQSVSHAHQGAMEETLRDYLLKRGVEALTRVVTAPDPFAGAEGLVAAYGLGSLVPNTVILGDSLEVENHARYCDAIRQFHRAERNVIIVRSGSERPFGRRRRIDVWWGGLRRNGGLMMILAYLVRTSLEWRGSEVVLKLVVGEQGAAPRARANLEAIIERSRTGVRGEVLVAASRPFDDILHQSSADADLVLLGIAEPDDDFASYMDQLKRRLEGLPDAALVLAAEDLAFGEVLS